MTDRNDNTVLEISISGIGESANITEVVANVISSGKYEQILQEETEARPHRGSLDNLDRTRNLPELFAVSGTNYDTYAISHSTPLNNSDMMGAGKLDKKRITVAFVTGVADTAGKNQSDFEDIMTVFYPDLVSIITAP